MGFVLTDQSDCIPFAILQRIEIKFLYVDFILQIGLIEQNGLFGKHGIEYGAGKIADHHISHRKQFQLVVVPMKEMLDVV